MFEQAEMRRALMQRDIGLVYRELMRFGLSQRLIAYYTMQSQSEISEVLTGRRISSYDVLERIYTGLHIPAGHMGMAYDLDTIHILGPGHPQWSAGLLGHQVITRRPAPAETMPADPYETRLGEEGPPAPYVATRRARGRPRKT